MDKLCFDYLTKKNKSQIQISRYFLRTCFSVTVAKTLLSWLVLPLREHNISPDREVNESREVNASPWIVAQYTSSILFVSYFDSNIHYHFIIDPPFVVRSFYFLRVYPTSFNVHNFWTRLKYRYFQNSPWQ